MTELKVFSFFPPHALFLAVASDAVGQPARRQAGRQALESSAGFVEALFFLLFGVYNSHRSGLFRVPSTTGQHKTVKT